MELFEQYSERFRNVWYQIDIQNWYLKYNSNAEQTRSDWVNDLNEILFWSINRKIKTVHLNLVTKLIKQVTKKLKNCIKIKKKEQQN